MNKSLPPLTTFISLINIDHFYTISSIICGLSAVLLWPFFIKHNQSNDVVEQWFIDYLTAFFKPNN